jgi:lipid A 3-O-deacylase
MPSLFPLPVALALAALFSPAATAQSSIDLSVGAFNLFYPHNESDGDKAIPDGEVQYRYGGTLYGVGPAVGAMANIEGGYMVYVGAYTSVDVGPIELTPLAAIGDYHQGGGKDLGSPLEFRLSLAATHDGYGLKFAHVSNAYTGKINPGDEELLVTYTFHIP